MTFYSFSMIYRLTVAFYYNTVNLLANLNNKMENKYVRRL